MGSWAHTTQHTQYKVNCKPPALTKISARSINAQANYASLFDKPSEFNKQYKGHWSNIWT